MMQVMLSTHAKRHQSLRLCLTTEAVPDKCRDWMEKYEGASQVALLPQTVQQVSQVRLSHAAIRRSLLPCWNSEDGDKIRLLAQAPDTRTGPELRRS